MWTLYHAPECPWWYMYPVQKRSLWNSRVPFAAKLTRVCQPYYLLKELFWSCLRDRRSFLCDVWCDGHSRIDNARNCGNSDIYSRQNSRLQIGVPIRGVLGDDTGVRIPGVITGSPWQCREEWMDEIIQHPTYHHGVVYWEEKRGDDSSIPNTC